MQQKIAVFANIISLFATKLYNKARKKDCPNEQPLNAF